MEQTKTQMERERVHIAEELNLLLEMTCKLESELNSVVEN